MTLPKWRTEQFENLAKAILLLKNEDEVAAFLRDLLTEPEIAEFSGRFAAAVELAAGKSQRTVATETNVSIATVTRVNQWLLRGEGGYQTIIARLTKSANPTSTKTSHHHKA